MSSPQDSQSPDNMYGRALEVFSKALGLSGAERRSFLDSACTGDALMRAEVESLLAHDAAVEGGGEDAEARAQKGVLGALAKESNGGGDTGCRAGDTLGPYKLLQQIGEGGFGTVFSAEQAPPLRRRVALKVLKAGMDTKEVIGRFEAERNALSLMNHPNIAKVFDVGATPSGRPYFVMEYVEGIAITEFCDLEELSLEARLRLFLEVCAAVQHAHQKGVIHRDLKPSNIMVTMQDGQPVPKVIDFGIAKATGQSLTDQTVFTLHGQLMGTPEYMSPEQAEMSGVGVDSTTDIYALGVVLYELLTGILPFDPKTLRSRGLAEIHRILREEEPKRPSTRVSTLGPSTTEIGKRRRTNPRKLKSDLSGDLDWIVMRAMEKQRTRRYPTASELAADLRRHLAHEPVQAGPPSAVYRMRKFVRRNRVAVSFATMALLLLVGGSVGTTLGMLDARRERAVAVDARLLAEAAGQATEAQRIEADAQRAEAVTQRAEAVAQRERAEENLALATAEGARARAVTDFLLETLGLADPDVTKLPEMSMADALDAAAAQVGEAFADYPENEAEIRRVIGTAYDTLGRPDLALPQLRRALHLYRNVLRSERTELADTMSVLYQVGQRVGEVDWVSIARNSLELRLSILAETDPDLARRFGLLTVDAKDPFVLPSLVKKAWGELCALARERIRPSDGAWPNVRILMYAVPLTMGWRSLTTDAPEMMEELLAQGLTGTSHRRVRYVTKMALYFRIRAGDYAGAKALASERVARLTEILGPDHWYLETYRSVIGECLAAEGRHDEAQAILEHSLAVLERPGALIFEDAVETRLRLAKLHEASGHPERAAPHRQALVDYALGLPFSIQWTMLRDYLGPEYTEVVEAIDEFDALVLQCATSDEPLRSRAGELTAIIQRILETRRRLCPDGGSVALLVADHMVERAEILLSASGLEEAREALLVEAMRLVRLHRDERPLLHVIGAAILFSHLIDIGDEERVRAVCLELDALVPEVLQEPGKVNFGALNSNSLTWYLVKSPGLAQETYAVIARFAALVLLAAPDRAEYSNTIGVALYRAGRYEEAIGHLAESDRLLRLDPERGGPVGSPADQAFLAMAHHRLGHGAEAAEAMERLGRLMQEASAALRPENQAFLAEAEAVLAD